jgi:hypothetical protein
MDYSINIVNNETGKEEIVGKKSNLVEIISERLRIN